MGSMSGWSTSGALFQCLLACFPIEEPQPRDELRLLAGGHPAMLGGDAWTTTDREGNSTASARPQYGADTALSSSDGMSLPTNGRSVPCNKELGSRSRY